jgi:putative FmdB family regulatory protein
VPFYEYTCPACGEQVEEMKRMSDRANGPDCPSCGEPMVLAMSMTSHVGGGNGSTSTAPVSAGGSCGPGFT